MISPLTDEESNRIKQIKENNEDYTSTIIAAQTFISILTWNNGSIINDSHYSIGRKMHTSEKNKFIADADVTPDIVVENYSSLGYVIEIKKSLPNDINYWEDVYKQLLKYDDDLLGWWEPTDGFVENPTIVMLIHQTRQNRFLTKLLEYLKVTGQKFDRRFCIIGFIRSDEIQQYYLHQLHYGSIVPNDINDRLIESISVPVERIFSSFRQLKFFDCPPLDIEYTMGVLWQNFFNKMPRGEYDRNLKGNPILVNIDDLTDSVQQSYGNKKATSNRDVEFPKRAWINDALECFVKINLAKKLDENNYIIIFKLIQQEMVEYFGKKLLNKKNTPTVTQPLLFNKLD